MKKYTILYYISSAIMLILFLLSFCHLPNNPLFGDGLFFENLNTFLLYINVAIIVIITIFLIKKRKIEGNILFPIGFLLFTIVITIGCFLFNDRVIVPYIHFGYYARLVVYGFTLLNIYTCLGINKGDNK